MNFIYNKLIEIFKDIDINNVIKSDDLVVLSSDNGNIYFYNLKYRSLGITISPF